MVGVRRIRREKLRECKYREEYTRSLEGKGVEWNGDLMLSICGDR